MTDKNQNISIHPADGEIQADFPNIAQDYLEQAIDLNKELVRHPASSIYFLWTCEGRQYDRRQCTRWRFAKN